MAITTDDLYKQRSEIDNMTFSCKESHERLKIIRGYYASFLYASSLFNTSDSTGTTLVLYDYLPHSNSNSNSNTTGRTAKYGSHQKIYMSLQRSRVRNLIELGFILQKYHKLRKRAEYDIYLEITDDDINEAEKYFEECRLRIDFYKKNGDKHFTTAKKVITADVTSNGIKVIGGLKVLK